MLLFTHLKIVATSVCKFVGDHLQILDTRKTAPELNVLRRREGEPSGILGKTTKRALTCPLSGGGNLAGRKSQKTSLIR